MSSPDAPLKASLERLDGVDPASIGDPEQVQHLLEAAIKLYVGLLEEGHRLAPLPDGSRVTATELVVTISNLLDQADIEVFELGMWRSWGRV
jgi:hypothetical protein